MTPLGLHHIMGWDHHHGPGPWIDKGRADWTSVYYHKADSLGIGFERSASGSNAVSQYFPQVAAVFGTKEKCPENILLWFHHVKWDEKLTSGRTLWDELCYKYQQGLDGVRQMQKNWEAQKTVVDEARFRDVQAFLKIQEKEALWWHHACILYFQTFSKRPIPEGIEKPEQALEYYKNIQKKFVPGI
jgi:alpha-glucuronidase